MNYCHNCGFQLANHSNFCSKCGIKLEETELRHDKGSRQTTPDKEVTSQNRQVKSILLSKDLSNKVDFSELSIVYKNIEIPYIDVWSINCHSVKSTVNFVLSRYDYYFSVSALKERTINIHFASIFGIGNNSKQIIFDDLFRAAELYIFPILLKKLIAYVSAVEPLQIGSLVISEKGLARKRILRESDFLRWEYFNKCDIKKGQIYIYELTSERKLSVFTKVPLSCENAILLPDLFEWLKRIAIV